MNQLDVAESEALKQLLRIERQIAEFCKNQGDAEQAILVLERSLEIAENAVGSEHLEVAAGLSELGIYMRNSEIMRRRSLFSNAV